VTRPILIVGPLSEAVIEKLSSDYPHKFTRCEPEFMNCNQEALEKGIMDNVLIDFRRRGSHYECTTVSAIKDICERVTFKLLKLASLSTYLILQVKKTLFFFFETELKLLAKETFNITFIGD
jgi:hypothetical protein